jgi:predicted amino acid racemase
MAQLVIHLEKLRHNIASILSYCHSKNLEIVGIIKGSYAKPVILKEFQRAGIKTIGTSKISTAEETARHLDEKPILITLPSPAELDAVLHWTRASLNSEIQVIRELADRAYRLKKNHGIILMVDNGDLREGVMPEDVLDTTKQIMEIRSPYIEFLGLGANLGCCSGTLPDEQNIALLQELALDIENRLGYHIQTVSIGGSVMLDWLSSHALPSKINQIRIGEAIMLGNIPGINQKHPELYDDVLLFEGEILEIKEKPGQPLGTQGTDALGRKPLGFRAGIRKRAILNFGVVDTNPGGLTALHENIHVVTSNADYTIVDITECPNPLSIGSTLSFRMNYRAMIQAFCSPFVNTHLVSEN